MVKAEKSKYIFVSDYLIGSKKAVEVKKSLKRFKPKSF
jgi:hypothetical protein